MKPTIENLQDSFAISRDVYKDSDIESQEIVDMYHNRQYTQSEINVLNERGQPVETFNIIKTFCNAISGYTDTVVNTVQLKPRYDSNSSVALLLNDAVTYVLDENEFELSADKAELDGLLTGKMCFYYDVKDTEHDDVFGRNIKELEISHVPSWQIRTDPMSVHDDGRDSRFTHRWRWVDEEEFNDSWPHIGTDNHEAAGNKAEAYSTFGVDDPLTDFELKFGMRLRGKNSEWNNYLVVHTIMRDGGTTWSVLWHGDIILAKKKVPFKVVKSPYRIVIMSNSDKAEHYGPFREVVETQKAVNQALIQIQLLINTKKAIVESRAVEDVDEFADQFNRVNNVVEVKSLKGIEIIDLSKDVRDQYGIIDRALERIKTILGVNDSFLGQAFASDSGRKVNIQQEASKSQLSVVTKRFQFMHKMVGEDVVNFIKQYYTASQVLRISDKINGDRYLELNKPILVEGADGQMGPVYSEELDPDSGEPMEDEEGNIVMTPVNHPDTDLKFADVDVKVVASPYNNAVEQNQLLFETFLNGPLGQAVLKTNPGGYYAIAAMQVSEVGTKSSQAISDVLAQTGMMVSNGQMDPSLAMGMDDRGVMGGALGGSNGGGPKSPTLQIPQGGN